MIAGASDHVARIALAAAVQEVARRDPDLERVIGLAGPMKYRPRDPDGPFGAKEAGEGSLAAFLPALTNAIADAIGIRFNDLPVTPDRVFEAIEKRRRASEKSKKNGGGR